MEDAAAAAAGTGTPRRTQREAAVKARNQLATALQEEARVAIDDLLEGPTSRQDGIVDLPPDTRKNLSLAAVLKVSQKRLSCHIFA